ncbi:Lrp/AsnC family transcriptional regulator [Sedimentitalea sp. JM2-8]|uniref:siroheme decarboxylase n=1 Tax=Sedimentitalea xiamensis TaxID=3050037 RepID=A0ABT7FDY2_9RHOB|nr:Lrp/AsnC family transcriptional regulator [Sedimentitalea xiamensis]MDK3073329.1 Lrp/AsnC family transcriptional regulator [Sedimentitalea xiamensis]
MDGVTDRITQSLLDDWQRDFPITQRPFLKVAETLGLTESDVIERLETQRDNGRITRVGATCAPNAVSASTLAAVSAPEDRIEDVAALIGAEAGINHSYLREHDWNLWFVATGPDRAHVNNTLNRISARTGLRVMDLQLVRPFNVDLGFALRRNGTAQSAKRPVDASVFQPGDRPILQALTRGLPLVPRPYAALAATLDRTEADVLARIAVLSEAAIIARLGVIVRHRALGWRSNAMVVWDMPHDKITTAGPLLAAQPGITLCYERTPVAGLWPYRLYSMIHARSRADALDVLTRVCTLPEFADVPHIPLFSLHCFKQTGALVSEPAKEVA